MAFGNVAAERAAIESTYEGTCTVTAFQTVKHPITHVTGQQRISLLKMSLAGYHKLLLLALVRLKRIIRSRWMRNCSFLLM